MNIQPRVKEVQFRAEGPEPLVRALPAASPYPVHALGPLRGAVEAVQGMTQAPIAIPAQSALTIAALAVQGFADVETLGGPRPVSLFALTIAQSGERKSSCDALLIAGLREHERQHAAEVRAETENWRNAQAIWKCERDRILAEARKTGGEHRAAAQADLEALGPEPAPPASADRTVAEPTFEGLTRFFAEGQPSLGLFSDEGGQFLGGYAMNRDNRQKTLAALNDLWQGNPIRRTRSGDGHTTLRGRRLSVHLMVQPGVARDFMADPMTADMGFLARFLISEPESTIGTRFARNTRQDLAALGAFEERLRKILGTPMPMDPETRELLPRSLPLSADARALLTDFGDTIEAAQAPGGDLSHITGAASKVAEQAARIAGVLTLWGSPHAQQVEAETMSDGIELAQYHLYEVSRLANAAGVPSEISLAETLRLWLLESWKDHELLVRDVLNRGPNRLRDSPKARAAIALLVQHGWLVPLPEGAVVRGAARKQAWTIVRGATDVV